MSLKVSANPVESQELGRISARISFLYAENSSVSRKNNALTFSTEEHVIYVPSAMVACIVLGSGTVISQQGISLLADAGVSVVWAGQEAVRFYASGSSLARTSRFIQKQAELVSNRRKRLQVARAMYAQRFPGEDVSTLTMQQLRGREGARVRKNYRQQSQKWDVSWHGRQYQFSDFSSSDRVNQALSAANAALYGVVHSAITALGCSPALGFIHNGHNRAFVFDIADLYKAELSIPVAFEVAAGTGSPGASARRLLRDRIHKKNLLPRICRDIRILLFAEESLPEDKDLEGDVLYLWDDLKPEVKAGHNYAVQAGKA